MPKLVDHAERRAHITDALVRVAAREGLHAVTMRSVAAEADVSLRLVQYYFDTKAQLMLAALERLEERSHERWSARLAKVPHPVPPRAAVEALLTEALPTDGPSRTFHLVWTSYAVLAMTDPDLAQKQFTQGPDRLERRLTDLLRQGQGDGALRPGLDAAVESARLLALAHGLSTGVLVGQRTADEAMAVLGYHLDRLFA